MAIMPMPVMASATPPTTTASVAAEAASPRCSGASEWWPRPRAPAADAARTGRRAVMGDGLYAVRRIGCSATVYCGPADALRAAAATAHATLARHPAG